MEHQRVGIIGAGISGLLACKYALSKGFCSVVFEARSSIGGVWTKTIQVTKLQTPKPIYQFSDFPWPPSVVQDFPDQHQVLDYLQSYVVHFDLHRHIRFNSKVVNLSYEGPEDEEIQAWTLWGGSGNPFSPTTTRGNWSVTVQDCQSLSESDSEVHQFDFVILCVGRFSDVPNIPEFPPGLGPEVFQGKVIHSMDYSHMDDAVAADFIKGKRVAVVGFQKSAMDIAMECSMANGQLS